MLQPASRAFALLSRISALHERRTYYTLNQACSRRASVCTTARPCGRQPSLLAQALPITGRAFSTTPSSHAKKSKSATKGSHVATNTETTSAAPGADLQVDTFGETPTHATPSPQTAKEFVAQSFAQTTSNGLFIRTLRGPDRTEAIQEAITLHLDSAQKAKPFQAIIVTPTTHRAQDIWSELFSLPVGQTRSIGTYLDGTKDVANLNSDIVIGTPETLADLVRNGEAATFKSVKLIVFDDAKQLTQHGMLHNVGLLNDHLPEKGSSPIRRLMFSSSVDTGVQKLAVQTLGLHYDYQSTLPEDITLPSNATPSYTFIPRRDQFAYLIGTLVSQVSSSPYGKAVVFFPTDAETAFWHALFTETLKKTQSTLAVHTIHGNVDTHSMERVLSDFAQAQSSVLFATDVAIKEDTLKNISHAFQIGLPRDVSLYESRWRLSAASTGALSAEKLSNSTVETGAPTFKELVQRQNRPSHLKSTFICDPSEKPFVTKLRQETTIIPLTPSSVVPSDDVEVWRTVLDHIMDTNNVVQDLKRQTSRAWSFYNRTRAEYTGLEGEEMTAASTAYAAEVLRYKRE